jgi:hypothetical protein
MLLMLAYTIGGGLVVRYVSPKREQGPAVGLGTPRSHHQPETGLEALSQPLSATAPSRRLQPKYRSQLSVGFLIGVSVMIINLLLITAIISGANFADFGLTGPGYDPKSSTQAVTAFASLLLIAEVRAVLCSAC